MRPGFDCPPWHEDEKVSDAFTKLMDALITFNRNAGVNSAFIYRDTGGHVIRLEDGKPVLNLNVTDEQLLGTIP